MKTYVCIYIVSMRRWSLHLQHGIQHLHCIKDACLLLSGRKDWRWKVGGFVRGQDRSWPRNTLVLNLHFLRIGSRHLNDGPASVLDGERMPVRGNQRIKRKQYNDSITWSVKRQKMENNLILWEGGTQEQLPTWTKLLYHFASHKAQRMQTEEKDLCGFVVGHLALTSVSAPCSWHCLQMVSQEWSRWSSFVERERKLLWQSVQAMTAES